MTTNEIVQRTDEDQIQRLSELQTVTPPVDIYENDDGILIVADFPGVDPDTVNLRLDDGQLDLEGKQSVYTDEQAPTPVLFARSFRISDTIDPEGVSAELKSGVLRVSLKKSEAAKPRQIKVTAG